MGDRSAAPPEFVSYVDRRLRALEAAASRLTGDDAHAERLAGEMLTLVALRWRRLTRSDTRHELVAGTSADLYVTQLFQQEAAELGYPRVILNLEKAPQERRRTLRAGQLPAEDEAALLWEGARGKTRRRLLIAGGAGAVLAVVALCRGGGAEEPQEEALPVEVETGLPGGAQQMPTGVLDSETIPGVPEKLSLPTQTPPPLGQNPLPRAILLVGSTVLPDQPLYALADNGMWRHIDVGMRAAGTLVMPNSLSPDGKAVVLSNTFETAVVDLTTGRQRLLPGVVASAGPVWLSEQQVLINPSALFDRATDRVETALAGPENVVTPRVREADDRTNTMIELLSAGQPLTAPARVRRWNLAEKTSVTIPLSGRLADLVGPWEGAAIGYGDGLVARLCRPAGNLPSSVRVSWMVAVVSPKTGEVSRLLMIDSAVSGVPILLGWESERRLLLALGLRGGQEVVSWDRVSEKVVRVTQADFVGTLSIRDLTRVA
ncbi:MAG TPA: hypothetical protein VF062_03400 [Candidatus Limnocylindrales bacterium]